MTEGDVINIFLGSGTLSYQPASGVEIMVLANMFGDAATTWGFVSSTQSAFNIISTANLAYGNPFQKFGITNTNYYEKQNTYAAGGFSGIQIK